jgi:hypothetical protein
MKYVGRFVSLFICFVIACSFGVYSQTSREVRKTVELKADGKVFIDTYKGSITIETWDKPQVDILARIEADPADRDREENVRETEIRINDSQDRVRIESDYCRLHNHHSSFFGLFGDNSQILPFVHYTISMPRTAQLAIKDYKSDTKISKLQASVDLNTYKGTVNISGFEGSIDLETYKGEATVDIAKLSGSSRIETHKGKIDVTMPHDISFELVTDLGRHANLDSDFDSIVRSKRHSEESYRATINNGGPRLRINSEKGDIRLKKR